MVMAQDPDSTEYDGMPRSAIATGLVDYVLSPEQMGAQLIAYVAHAFGRLTPAASDGVPDTGNALKKIFVLLRDQTDHDFSQYKPNTIQRRIERRMAIHQIKDLDDYVKFLRQTPVEVEALFRELLIGVTHFFRDPEAFEVLEKQIIPKLLTGRSAGTILRVWVPGCSTGEEAYSIAILLHEQLETLKQGMKLQIFATDVDSHAISTARAGVYPASIAADISPERLTRFFVAEPDGAGEAPSAYRINKSIRDMLIFSEQDVIRDPPFSKLDLLSCRNVLIYMGGELQKRLIPLFHYALNPGGTLFLGTSETVGEYGDLFSAADRRAKLYQRKDDFHAARRAALGRFPLLMPAHDEATPRTNAKKANPTKPTLRELTEQALLHYLPLTAALVDAQGDILYFHGRTGLYLEPTPGEAGVNNILKMARAGLTRDLTFALKKAESSKETVRRPGLRVKTNGDSTEVTLTVLPVVPDLDRTQVTPMYLVILEKTTPLDRTAAQGTAVQPGAVGPGAPAGGDTDPQVAALMQELHAKEEYLQSTNEELQSANEELKSSNEEMQSINEELQSTNEELETTKEELQSLNEELSTVNAELHTKIEDLSRANNDMNNLLAGTNVATIFVDHQLRILRFTPAAAQIINMIPSDLGRPVNHIASNLADYNNLVQDVQDVLKSLVPMEATLQTTDEAWFKMRVQPYRTIENVIEGAVITFINITEMMLAQEALQEAFNEIRTLHGILPICSGCKKIRDEQGNWNELEKYFTERSDTEFSHGLCQECMKKMYPEYEGNEE